ncbi:Cell division protein FtsP [Streptomyces sp. RB5]|uniref:Cell division protein FtsP n=1 Tax=Streptomyces smaragdinus TaxID=2585196 RepID=A0A7K0CHH2_9ACTN|nr:multicopper oxidase domain-containing protein [Streptomyces smaragdinus]MQY12930.1 Cell division protein FtsP [Streptomyces smaragdinus]
MTRTKILAGLASFSVALAVPWWTVPQESAPAPAAAAARDTATDDPASPDAPDPHAAMDWKAMDKEMAKRDKSFPAKTKGTGAQPLAPKILADGTKQFTLTAQNIKWEVEPGKTVDAMAYNGQIPGPAIRVDVGDRVRVILKNELRESTVIHWHGIPVTNKMDGVANVTQDPVPPGKSFTYDITASRQSVGWFHSHHDGVKQVTSGLWGTFQIGDLPLPGNVKPDKEIPFSLQDSGALGLTFNGKSFPATAPVRLKKGQSLLVHYYNAGDMPHPMHLHGLDQLVVAKDGFPLEDPYKADTILIAPGERYSVLIKADQLGTWSWHCHILSHSESSKGMTGMFTELIVT